MARLWRSLCDISSFVLPCLLDFTVVEVWLVDSLAWDLRLRRNLPGFEIQEYATYLLHCPLSGFAWCLIIKDGILTPLLLSL